MTTAQGYPSNYLTSQSATFAQRCRMSLKNQAVAVYNEGTGVTGHVTRAAFATKVLNNQVDFAALVETLSAQGNDASTTDAALDSSVDSLWNALAGA